MIYLLYTSLSDNFDMVSCPKGGAEFPPKDIWAEVFQAKELETRKELGNYIIFMCPLCQVFLDIKV